MFPTNDSGRGSVQAVHSGNVFGYMKYSFFCLLFGNIYSPDLLSHLRLLQRRAGNDSLHASSGFEGVGGAEIRTSDHENRGSFWFNKPLCHQSSWTDMINGFMACTDNSSVKLIRDDKAAVRSMLSHEFSASRGGHQVGIHPHVYKVKFHLSLINVQSAPWFLLL